MMKLEENHRAARGVALTLAFALAVPVAAAPNLTLAKKGKRKCGTRAECREKEEAAKRKAARNEAIELAYEKAEAERAKTLDRTEARREAGDVEAAALLLGELADERGDAALQVEAAAVSIEVPGSEGVERAKSTLAHARLMLDEVRDPAADSTVDPSTIRVRPADVSILLDRCDTIEAAIKNREAELLMGESNRQKIERRGRQETAVGAGFISLGIAGLGLLGAGFGVEYDRERKLAPIEGHQDEYDLSSLDAQHERANTMIAVGAVVGAVGLSLGTALLVIGTRDRKRSRRRDERASFSILPGPGSVVITGHF